LVRWILSIAPFSFLQCLADSFEQDRHLPLLMRRYSITSIYRPPRTVFPIDRTGPEKPPAVLRALSSEVVLITSSVIGWNNTLFIEYGVCTLPPLFDPLLSYAFFQVPPSFFPRPLYDLFSSRCCGLHPPSPSSRAGDPLFLPKGFYHPDQLRV